MSVFRFFKPRSQRKDQAGGYYEAPGHGEPRFSQPHDPYQQHSLFINAAHAHQVSQPHGGQRDPYMQENYGQQPYARGDQSSAGGYPREIYPGDFQETSHRQTPDYASQNFQGREPTSPFDQNHPQQSHGTSVGPQFSPQSHQQQAPYTGQPHLQGTPANYPRGGGQDVRELRFWDKNTSAQDAAYDDRYQSRSRYAAEEDDDEPQPLRFVLALGILIIFAALAWLVFKWSTQTVSTTPPYIQADPNPFKVRPDNPGGMVVPHQDKLVYGRIGNEGAASSENNAPVERLLPPPEQPLSPGANTYGPQTIPGDQNYPQPQAGFQGSAPVMNAQGQPVQGMQGVPQNNTYSGQPLPGQQGQAIMQGQNGQMVPVQPPLAAIPNPMNTPQTGNQMGSHQGQHPSAPPMMPIPQAHVANHPDSHGAQQNGASTVDDGQGEGNFYPNNIVPNQGNAQGAMNNGPVNGAPQSGMTDSSKASKENHEKSKKDAKAKDFKAKDVKTPESQKNTKLVSSGPGEMPTGFFPGGLPVKKTEGATASQTQDPTAGKTKGQAKTTPSPNANQAAPSTAPKLYKAKLAAVGTKADAEKEWERLRFAHREEFQNLNKVILEKKSNGRTFFVVYGLGIKNQKDADNLCRSVGAGCVYEPQ